VSGAAASSTDPKTWCSFDLAVKSLEAGVHKADGIGFCFGDEWAGIEIDKCVVDGKLTDEARKLVDTFHTYAEISPSGNGIHLLMKSSKPLQSGATNKDGSVIATHGRFFTVTGKIVEGSSTKIEDCTELLHELLTQWKAEQKPSGEWNEASSMKFTDAVTKGAGEGSRHHTVVAVVGKCIREGMPEADALKIALEINAKSHPPKPEAVVANTVTDLYARYAEKDKKKKKWLIPFTEPSKITTGEGTIMFDWEDYSMRLSRFRDFRGGIEAQAEVRYDPSAKPLIVPMRTASASGYTDAVRILEHANDIIDWRNVVNYVLFEMSARFNPMRGALGSCATKLDTSQLYLIENLIPAGEIALVYGPGKSHKSFLALAMCIATALGKQLPGINPVRQGNVLYLNFEGSSKKRFENRLFQLCEGLGITDEERARLGYSLFFQNLTRSFTDIIEDVREFVGLQNIVLVVIDSFGAAAGRDPQEANAAIALMNAVDSLHGVSKILISHVAKYELQQRNGDGARLFAYGSIYITNLSRITWEVVVGENRTNDQEDAMTVNVALFNRESNYDMILPPLGFGLRFHPVSQATEVRIETIQVNEENGFGARRPISKKAMILNALSDAKVAFSKGEIETEYLTTKELSEAVEASDGIVRAECSELVKEGAIEVKYPNAGGKGKVQAWRVKPDAEGFSEVHE
jgi:hypothetical protein